MEARFDNLTHTGDKEEELILDGGGKRNNAELLELCLVGRFLTDKQINMSGMKHCLVGLWRPRRGVTIKEIAPQRVMFQFYHSVDVKRVLEGGLWTEDYTLVESHVSKWLDPKHSTPLLLHVGCICFGYKL